MLLTNVCRSADVLLCCRTAQFSLLATQPEETVKQTLGRISGLQSCLMMPLQFVAGLVFTRFGIMYGVATMPLAVMVFGATVIVGSLMGSTGDNAAATAVAVCKRACAGAADEVCSAACAPITTAAPVGNNVELLMLIVASALYKAGSSACAARLALPLCSHERAPLLQVCSLTKPACFFCICLCVLFACLLTCQSRTRSFPLHASCCGCRFPPLLALSSKWVVRAVGGRRAHAATAAASPCSPSASATSPPSCAPFSARSPT